MLWSRDRHRRYCGLLYVLILVLVDYALEQEFQRRGQNCIYVLILVLVDYALELRNFLN